MDLVLFAGFHTSLVSLLTELAWQLTTLSFYKLDRLEADLFVGFPKFLANQESTADISNVSASVSLQQPTGPTLAYSQNN